LSRPKFGFDAAAIGLLLDYIEHRGDVVASSPLICPVPDPDDAVFLEIALSGEAECLVTGNQVHFPAGLRQGATVLTPGEFVAFYQERQRGTGPG
jgi:predicted nucleic acid-binding protein